MTNKPVYGYKVNTLTGLKPNSFAFLKVENENKFQIYVTNKEGIPYTLKQNETGILTISSSDLSIDVNGTVNIDLKVSATLQNLINSALQAGDNISELINDAGYITTVDLPTNTSDLNNDGANGTSTYVEANQLGLTATTNNYNDLDNLPNLSAFEVTANKQNSLNVDGTGTKYVTVDAVNQKFNSITPPSFSNVVYVNSNNPNTATIFDLNNPPVTNDDSLKSNVNNLYIGLNSSTWTYNTLTAVYNTYTPSGGNTSNFYLSGTTIDAGSNKTAAIERSGTVGGLPGTATNHFVTKAQLDALKYTELSYACSDEISDLTIGTLITFRMPIALTLLNVKLSLNSPSSVNKVVVDVRKNGVSIFSTLASVDTGSTTSVGASVPVVISDPNLTNDAIITIHTTQVGSGNVGKGLKVTFLGNKI